MIVRNRKLGQLKMLYFRIICNSTSSAPKFNRSGFDRSHIILKWAITINCKIPQHSYRKKTSDRLRRLTEQVRNTLHYWIFMHSPFSFRVLSRLCMHYKYTQSTAECVCLVVVVVPHWAVAGCSDLCVDSQNTCCVVVRRCLVFWHTFWLYRQIIPNVWQYARTIRRCRRSSQSQKKRKSYETRKVSAAISALPAGKVARNTHTNDTRQFPLVQQCAPLFQVGQCDV